MTVWRPEWSPHQNGPTLPASRTEGMNFFLHQSMGLSISWRWSTAWIVLQFMFLLPFVHASLWSGVRLWVHVWQTAAEPMDPGPLLWTSAFLSPKSWCRFSPKQYTTCPHEWSGQQIGDAVYKRFVLKMPVLQVTLYFWSNFCSFFFKKTNCVCLFQE